GTGRSGRGLLGVAKQCQRPVLGSWRFPPARAFVCPDGYSAQHRGVLFISVPCSALFTLNRDAAIRPRLAGHWVARALVGKVRFARYERRKQDRTSPSPIESSVVISQGSTAGHEERFAVVLLRPVTAGSRTHQEGANPSEPSLLRGAWFL